MPPPVCPHCTACEASLAQKCGELNTAALELEGIRPAAAMFRALWSTLDEDGRREVLARVFDVMGAADEPA